jgi:hypothetical protein
MYKFVLFLILFSGIESNCVDYFKRLDHIDRTCSRIVSAQLNQDKYEDQELIMHKFCFFSVYHCLKYYSNDDYLLKQCIVSKLSNDFQKILHSSKKKKKNGYLNPLILLISFFCLSFIFLFSFLF